MKKGVFGGRRRRRRRREKIFLYNRDKLSHGASAFLKNPRSDSSGQIQSQQILRK